MPEDFNACVSAGGEVRTKRFKDGKFIKLCYKKGGGKGVAGEAKKAKKKHYGAQT